MDKPPQRPRLFAGIALDDTTRAHCASIAQRLEAHGFTARYEAPEKFHLTLAFLGNVEPERVLEAENALGTIADGSRSFTLTLDRLGAFPHERKPRIVFVGSRDQGQAYRDLASRTREAYMALGFTFEDDAIAHVTIARVKRDTHARPLPQLNLEPIELPVERIVLFESVPGKQTSRYVVRATAAMH